LEANDISNPPGDVESPNAGHSASFAMLTNIGGQIQGEQKILGFAEVSIALSIHIGSHDIGYREAFLALVHALLAGLTVDTSS